MKAIKGERTVLWGSPNAYASLAACPNYSPLTQFSHPPICFKTLQPALTGLQLYFQPLESRPIIIPVRLNQVRYGWEAYGITLPIIPNKAPTNLKAHQFATQSTHSILAFALIL